MPSNFADLWAVLAVAGCAPRIQADKIPVVLKIGRSVYTDDSARERQLHDAFKRAARPFVPNPLSSDWEWLALAQHHGAPTRPADWSTSPLVAAWFAATSYPEDTDAAIFRLEKGRTHIEAFDVVIGQSATA